MGQVEIIKQFEAEMNNNIKSFNLQKTKILKTLQIIYEKKEKMRKMTFLKMKITILRINKLKIINAETYKSFSQRIQ